MLKITRKVEYALLALRHMQAKNPGSVSSAAEISDCYSIPNELLAKTMQLMARENIVEAVQGPRGGYRVKAKLSSINLIEFFEKIEGPLGLMDCYFDSDCVQMDCCTIRTPIQKINDNLRNMFSNMTVQEITSA